MWGNFVKNWYFVNDCLIKVWTSKSFCTDMTHIIVIMYCMPHFVSTQSIFSCIQIPLPNLVFFTIKLPSVTQRSVSQEIALKKSETLLPFFHKIIVSNNSFALIENKFQVFKIAKFESKVTVYYGLWGKAPSCDPLRSHHFME